MTLLPAIEHQTRPQPDASVIWLHGLGADGHDFAPIVPELHLPEDLAIRFLFPHAPSIPVTVNGGYVMPAWFDIYEMDIDRKVDAAQLMASATAVRALVDREVERGVASDRIALAGFSQGGAVAYEVCLSHPLPLAGLIAMSTYFATSGSVTCHAANTRLPIEIQHGTYDQVVPLALGMRAAEQLRDRGYDIVFRTYPMEHAVCSQQIVDISRALQRFLAREGKPA